MPLIEVLPTSTAAAPAPGWAYVPDTGYDPSKAPINPTTRKRTARNAHSAFGSELSARQQAAIQRRLAELDKDSNRDIPIPEGLKRTRGKMTPGVKKILISQKTFKNHLDDEQAILALQQNQPPIAQRAPAAKKAARAPVKKAKLASLGRQASSSSTPVPSSAADINALSEPTAAPSPMGPPPLPRSAREDNDNEPLLAISVPTAPTPEEIEALLSAPALPYLAARASSPGPNAPPQRQFCEICGYWGRVRCMKCGARVCGLECKDAHEDPHFGRCSRLFA